jgi:vacuolar-type H+-ATPase subunit H
MATNAAKEHWGVKFSVVPNGLDEEQVVGFVKGLMEKTERGGAASEQQSSLVKLAEQTVIEADRLADRIKEESKKAAEAEADKILKAASDKAQAEARKVLQKAEKDTDVRSSDAAAKANSGAQDTLDTAHREAQGILERARDGADAIQAEAKLEAEFIIRRTAAQLAEEVRSALNEVSQTLLSDLQKSLEHAAGPEGAQIGKGGSGAAGNAAIASPGA